MTITTISVPLVEPMLAGDQILRHYLGLTEIDTDENGLLDEFIASARDMTEVYLRRRLITQTVRLTLDGFGCGGSSAINLPIAPIQSVDQVQYLDDAGDWQIVSTSVYRLVTSSEPPDLATDYGQVWPVPRMDRATVRIDLIVGYGDSGTDIPPRILQAIRLQVAFMLRNRGDIEAMGDLCNMARSILSPSILWL